MTGFDSTGGYPQLTPTQALLVPVSDLTAGQIARLCVRRLLAKKGNMPTKGEVKQEAMALLGHCPFSAATAAVALRRISS
jgi:hypothetical protein